MPYKIQHIFDENKKNNCVILSNNFSLAKIVLNQGASLQELTLHSIPIIKELPSISYDKSFASSILFPFANRIKNGKYTFNKVAYQTEINQLEEQNALHGFVHNKEFLLVKKQTNSHKAIVIVEYNETNFTKGFPFTYKIRLKYILKNNSLELKVQVENTSDIEFPFTLGWHPYFYSADVNESILKFNASKQVVFDDRKIPIEAKEVSNSENFQLKNKKLDDCFYLDNNIIEFVTPKYKMELSSSDSNSFLQLYTPKTKNTIAIEPTTGISNSFNSEIGLKILQPKEEYQISWKLTITNPQ